MKYQSVSNPLWGFIPKRDKTIPQSNFVILVIYKLCCRGVKKFTKIQTQLKAHFSLTSMETRTKEQMEAYKYTYIHIYIIIYI